MSARLCAVNNAVQALSVCYNEELVAQLRELGYNLKFDQCDPESFFTDLETVLKKSKTLAMNLQIANDKIEKLETDAEKDQEGNEDSFFEELAVIKKFSGDFSLKETTVSEYAGKIRMYQKYIIANKNAHDSKNYR